MNSSVKVPSSSESFPYYATWLVVTSMSYVVFADVLDAVWLMEAISLDISQDSTDTITSWKPFGISAVLGIVVATFLKVIFDLKKSRLQAKCLVQLSSDKNIRMKFRNKRFFLNAMDHIIKMACCSITERNLGRILLPEEKILVLKKVQISPKKTEVIFFYRRSSHESGGIAHQSVHMVDLITDPEKCSLVLRAKLSLGENDLIGVDDPIEHIERVCDRVGKDLMLE